MPIAEQTALAAWYMHVFVPEPEAGYAVMNPPTADAKYIRKTAAVTVELLVGGLLGATRRLPIAGQWHTIPRSFAITPMRGEGADALALAAMNDIDTGGKSKVQAVLDLAKQHGLWGFAQLGTSDKHDGGHVYIPSDTPLPASLLQDVAARLQAGAGASGEAYPKDADLRLPLMMHLRAPNGPTRFPLLLQDGTEIDASDPWAALATLQRLWQPNSTDALTQALESLPPPSVDRPAPLHKSKVNPQVNSSVISWYNDNHTVPELLKSFGAKGVDRRHVVICPWHTDTSPSLGIWKHRDTGRLVCKCFSANSGCKAAEQPYLDAFNLYRMQWELDASQAVTQLVEQYGLGQKRSYQTEQAPATPARSVASHTELITQARVRLADELQQAAERRGQVTAIRATPGLGKTHAGAELANQTYLAGQTVAIVAPSHDLAVLEWAQRLEDAVIWQSREKLCTCYPADFLHDIQDKGYVITCQPDCPYILQHQQAKGHIVIYQHNHLYLNGGELLAGADLVLIDESPMSALLAEQEATQDELIALANHVAQPSIAPQDPASSLIVALAKVGRKHMQHGTVAHSLRGCDLRVELETVLEYDLRETIATASTSHAAKKQGVLEGIHPAYTELPRIFFGSMLDALEAGTLAWTGAKWVWYERHTLLGKLAGKLTGPAVLVLDGSADALLAAQLYKPWPVALVMIDAPLSPLVHVVQCPITFSTRKIVQDPTRLDRVTRAIGGACHQLGITLDAIISYQGAEDYLSRELGAPALHYGGQRGRNDFAAARTLAIIASPTVPPDAIARKAEALWRDDAPPIALESTKVGIAEYTYTDPRLAAMHRLHGPEELRQAAHRCRPILSALPTTLLICSPWELASLDLSPHTTIVQLPYSNSADAEVAWNAYRAALTPRAVLVQSFEVFTIEGDKDGPTALNLKHIVNGPFYCTPTATGDQATTPLPATPSVKANPVVVDVPSVKFDVPGLIARLNARKAEGITP